MTRPPLSDHALDKLQRDTFDYFLKHANPTNGLVADTTHPGSDSSIAAVGLGLACYPIGAERGFTTRADAANRTLMTLRFFHNAPHGEEPDATGYRGFYYHFLDMRTGRRAGACELSTIDSTFLIAGALVSARYFDRDVAAEREIRALADALYRRADWQWALNGGTTVSHGWKPESGFLKWRWDGYDEALLLYVLGLGSPTYPLPPESYHAWTQTYQWRRIYDFEFLYAGPLFIHQLSHIWIDFQGIQDAYMRDKGIDYFENSRRAVYVQQQYAIRNPKGFDGYQEHCWGITASDGPGPATRRIHGIEREFFNYLARGVPDGPDDGTLSPWALVASLPFAPEIVLPAIRYFQETYPEVIGEYGFKCSFNPTFSDGEDKVWHGHGSGFVSHTHFGLDQGPIVLMIENYQTGFIWRLMRDCPHLVDGLRKAGFTNGWLSG